MRTLEVPFHHETIKQLIISHLHNIGVIHDTEEVTALKISKKTGKLYQLEVSFGPETQVIFHP